MPKVQNGMLVDPNIVHRRFENLEHCEMNKVVALVLHQTDSPTAKGTFNHYAGKDKNGKPVIAGGHFLIDKDGTIYQTARIDKRAYHVMKQKSKCLEENSCTESSVEAELYQSGKHGALTSYELRKDHPFRYPTNNDSLAIELVGKFKADSGYEQPTRAQVLATALLIEKLQQAGVITNVENNIFAHGQISREKKSTEGVHILRELKAYSSENQCNTTTPVITPNVSADTKERDLLSIESKSSDVPANSNPYMEKAPESNIITPSLIIGGGEQSKIDSDVSDLQLQRHAQEIVPLATVYEHSRDIATRSVETGAAFQHERESGAGVVVPGVEKAKEEIASFAASNPAGVNLPPNESADHLLEKASGHSIILETELSKMPEQSLASVPEPLSALPVAAEQPSATQQTPELIQLEFDRRGGELRAQQLAIAEQPNQNSSVLKLSPAEVEVALADQGRPYQQEQVREHARPQSEQQLEQAFHTRDQEQAAKQTAELQAQDRQPAPEVATDEAQGRSVNKLLPGRAAERAQEQTAAQQSHQGATQQPLQDDNGVLSSSEFEAAHRLAEDQKTYEQAAQAGTENDNVAYLGSSEFEAALASRAQEYANHQQQQAAAQQAAAQQAAAQQAMQQRNTTGVA